MLIPAFFVSVLIMVVIILVILPHLLLLAVRIIVGVGKVWTVVVVRAYSFDFVSLLGRFLRGRRTHLFVGIKAAVLKKSCVVDEVEVEVFELFPATRSHTFEEVMRNLL